MKSIPNKYITTLRNKFHGKIVLVSTGYTKLKDKYTFSCVEHGKFVNTLDSVLHSNYGCPVCRKLGRATKRAYTFEEFVEKAGKVHEGKYVYHKIDRVYVHYTCDLHGEIRQRKAEHLSGASCRHCARIAAGVSKRLSIEKLKCKLNSLNTGYDYSESYLIHNCYGRNPTIVYKCNHHGEVRQDVQNHLKGKGCPMCRRGFLGKPKDTLTYLYVVHFYTVGLWKLGVTIHEVSRRFSAESLPYTLTVLVNFPSGKEAYRKEKELSVILKDRKYHGDKVLHSGNTELYVEDIAETTTRHLGNVPNLAKNS